MAKTDNGTKHLLLLSFVFLIGILFRLFFFTGHIFSDDAYYAYLSQTLVSRDFLHDYLGYPVFPLRMVFIGLTAFSMMIFGVTEFATIFFPFLFSILNIFLTYKLAELFTAKKEIALMSSLLIAFFPTDVIFASIGFPDLINIFFINLGIYLLFKSYVENKKLLSYLGGLSLFLSMQFKETIYYVLFLMIAMIIYFFIKNRRINFQLAVGLIFIFLNYLIEGFVYLLLHNDFFYRITTTNLNYQYSFYDFFPYTAQKLSGSRNYLRNLFHQIFLINLKSVFLRRFYLFLPLLTVVQTYFILKEKKSNFLLFWFWGLAVLMVAFTTSFSEYKPIDLARSWYIYPLLMPMIILSAIFINRFSKLIKTGLIAIYIIGSLIMCFEYQIFFDTENLNSLKTFLRHNQAKTIYTDHYTKYSVDLIRDYNSDSKKISGENFNFSQIANSDWILFNKKHIEELQLQKYKFPDFSILNSNQYRKVAAFNDFVFYEKLH